MIESRYMTTTELASDLGVHRATIVRWIKAGIIPAKRLGPRTFKIVRQDVETVLNHNH
jgi:excisionase family DNA binding protein